MKFFKPRTQFMRKVGLFVGLLLIFSALFAFRSSHRALADPVCGQPTNDPVFLITTGGFTSSSLDIPNGQTSGNLQVQFQDYTCPQDITGGVGFYAAPASPSLSIADNCAGGGAPNYKDYPGAFCAGAASWNNTPPNTNTSWWDLTVTFNSPPAGCNNYSITFHPIQNNKTGDNTTATITQQVCVTYLPPTYPDKGAFSLSCNANGTTTAIITSASDSSGGGTTGAIQFEGDYFAAGTGPGADYSGSGSGTGYTNNVGTPISLPYIPTASPVQLWVWDAYIGSTGAWVHISSQDVTWPSCPVPQMNITITLSCDPSPPTIKGKPNPDYSPVGTYYSVTSNDSDHPGSDITTSAYFADPALFTSEPVYFNPSGNMPVPGETGKTYTVPYNMTIIVTSSDTWTRNQVQDTFNAAPSPCTGPPWSINSTPGCNNFKFSFNGNPTLTKITVTDSAGNNIPFTPTPTYPVTPGSKVYSFSDTGYPNSSVFTITATPNIGPPMTIAPSSPNNCIAGDLTVSATCNDIQGDVSITMGETSTTKQNITWALDNPPPPGITVTPNLVSANYYVANTTTTVPITSTPHVIYASFGSGPGKQTAQSPQFSCIFPYFTVSGGDIAAGSTFGCVAPPEATAGIFGPTTTSNTYAGNQLANVAIGLISNFASNLAPGNSGISNSLDFANSPANGKFNNTAPCMPNLGSYAANCTHNTLTTSDMDQVASGSWCSSTDLTANLSSPGATIGTGKNITIFVNGNLQIPQSLTYQTGWTKPADIPSLTFVVTGNIYIKPGVSEVDGNYAAMSSPGNPNTGIVYTCTNEAVNLTPSSPSDALYAGGACGKSSTGSGSTLTINGSLMAKQIAFERTYGADTTVVGPTLNGSAAEKINYGPAVWLSGYANSKINTTVQSITDLPPVL